MKMEPALPEPSCGTSEATALGGSSTDLERLEISGKWIKWS